MVHKAYAVFDIKADAYNPPFFAPTHGMAIRMFTDIANDKASMIGKYPADFKLLCIGGFDTNKGCLIPSDPESLGFATDYVRKADA